MTVNGFTVYPAEVEQVIVELEGVDAVAVIGAPGGRRRGADGRLRGRRGDLGTGGRALPAADCRRTNGRGRSAASTALPRTVTGMVRRGALRRQLAEEPS